MRTIALALLLATAFRAGAEEPTELYDCLDDANGPDFCRTDSTVVLVDEGCGVTFNRYHDTIAWLVLRNVGPVTISVKTRYVRFGRTLLPLYVEIISGTTQHELTECRTDLGGHLILVAQGGPECGGAWESVGPIDLRLWGVRPGELYSVQVVFFESIPDHDGETPFYSVGFSCIRVTSHPTAVAPATWSAVKVLFL